MNSEVKEVNYRTIWNLLKEYNKSKGIELNPITDRAKFDKYFEVVRESPDLK